MIQGIFGTPDADASWKIFFSKMEGLFPYPKDYKKPLHNPGIQ